ncbi:hypothetical protein B4N89_20810 [Embleya scabrispora]|uniref:Uncharacterized protein n=1 Tax=Embleya scabrispora TaxID=159449 RepID=A0A1T3P226_9ACTN|nr:hypothetical protein [Embleya scabrispora]OPC83054.1 hypothetical protein B4N89_20810 [Embleya scabrispora]
MIDPATRAKWDAHVRRQAHGLRLKEIAKRLRGVRAWERNTLPDNNYSSVGAACSAGEWQRIHDLMTETGRPMYQIERDPVVQREQREQDAAIDPPLTLAELAAAENVWQRLQTMRAAPAGWTVRQVALTIRLDRIQRGMPPADLVCVGTCDCCGRPGQQLQATPGAWVCADLNACAANGGLDE